VAGLVARGSRCGGGLSDMGISLCVVLEFPVRAWRAGWLARYGWGVMVEVRF